MMKMTKDDSSDKNDRVNDDDNDEDYDDDDNDEDYDDDNEEEYDVKCDFNA